MRFLLLSCVLSAAACNNSAMSTPEDFAVPIDMAAPTGPDLRLDCTPTCATCASGTVCVTAGSGLIPFSATCLKSCTSNVDCGGSVPCVEIYGSLPAGRYCLDANQPQTCGAMCDLVPAISFCDGSEIVSPYNSIVCGAKYMHCANGCVEDAPDGGTDRHARCL